jgi:hypothetical protein
MQKLVTLHKYLNMDSFNTYYTLYSTVYNFYCQIEWPKEVTGPAEVLIQCRREDAAAINNLLQPLCLRGP